MKRSKLMASLAIAAGLLVGGAGGMSALRAAPAADGQVSQLLRARAEAASAALSLAQRRYEQGLGGYEDVLSWSRREIDAKLELAANKEERIALLKELVKRSMRAEAIAADRQKLGTGDPLEVQAARFERLGAEIRLARAQSE